VSGLLGCSDMRYLVYSCFRDVAAEIRNTCLQELRKWMTSYPSEYLQDERFLKNIVRGLNDDVSS